MIYFIISSPRSGSTKLFHTIYNALKTTQNNTFKFGETLSNEKRPHRKKPLDRHITEDILGNQGNIVLKDFANWIDDLDRGLLDWTSSKEVQNAWETFKNAEKYNILLLRENIVDQIISLSYGMQTKLYIYYYSENTKCLDVELKKEFIDEAFNIIVRNYNLFFSKHKNIADEIVTYGQIKKSSTDLFLSLKMSKKFKDSVPNLPELTHPTPYNIIYNETSARKYVAEKLKNDKNLIYFPIDGENLDLDKWNKI